MCPYFAMFPETFVERWVTQLSSVGDLVADPFSGRGTTAFQSILLGRAALAADINPVAYVLTRAKTNSPTQAAAHARVLQLERSWKRQRGPKSTTASTSSLEAREFFELAFHRTTLDQLDFLRGRLRPLEDDVDCMVSALVLGALHGEMSSPRYLSNQMPRTISTKPGYSVRFWREHGLVSPPERDVFAVLLSALEFRYATGRPRRRARIHLGDMRGLPRLAPRGKVRLIVTSPPYLDTTSFEEDQWLRLWFLGGPRAPHRGRISRDDRLSRRDDYWRLIADLWRTSAHLLMPGGHLVVRIAGRGLSEEDLREGLLGTSAVIGRKVRLVSVGSSAIARRQTDSFRPGSTGLKTEIDCHFEVA